MGCIVLELRSLRHLVVLARRLNYVRAADELGITQPALSRSIQTLEQHLDVRLFDRDRSGVSLTPQGRLIAERARLLLLDAEDIEHHSRMYARGERGSIRFGMAPMPARALLQPILSEQLNLMPAITHEVVVRDVEELWGMLTVGEIEFFVCPDRPLHDLSQAQVEHLGEFPLSLIVRAGHPLLNGAPPEDRFPLVRSSWTGMSVPNEIENRILGKPNIVEDFSVLAGLASATDVIWLSSAYAILDEIRNGTLVELFRARQRINLGLYSLKRRSRSPLAVTMTAALRRCVESLTQEPGA